MRQGRRLEAQRAPSTACRATCDAVAPPTSPILHVLYSRAFALCSFGVVIWEVCTGDVPVRGEMRALCAPADCPPEVVALYERCISEDPEQRPTAAELLVTLSALL